MNPVFHPTYQYDSDLTAGVDCVYMPLLSDVSTSCTLVWTCRRALQTPLVLSSAAIAIRKRPAEPSRPLDFQASKHESHTAQATTEVSV